MQASLVIGGVDGAGRAVISTYPDRAKTLEARRRPEAGVVVLSDGWNRHWLQIDGLAETLEISEAIDALVTGQIESPPSIGRTVPVM